MAKILVLAGGGTKHLKPFVEAGKNLGIEVVFGSFSQIEYLADEDCAVKLNGVDLKEFSAVYFRLVGKREEDALLVCRYLNLPLGKLPIKKSLETFLLAKAAISTPKTYFGTLEKLFEKGPKLFGYPFIVKGTYGKQGHAVWLIKSVEEGRALFESLAPLEKEGKRYLCQELIRITEKTRVLVIGGKIIGSIVVPTKWRRYVAGKGYGQTRKLTDKEKEVAVYAAKVAGIDIAGVDLICDNETGKAYVLEVNSAPRWAKFEKVTGIKVEEEILKYLVNR